MGRGVTPFLQHYGSTQTAPTHVRGEGHAVVAHTGRRQNPVEHSYGAGQGEVVLQVVSAQTLVAAHRSAPPQSALEVQSRWQAPTLPQVVPVGQSLSVPQPVQMPPGAVVVQVLRPGQSELVRH